QGQRNIAGFIVFLCPHSRWQRSREALLTGGAAQDLLLVSGRADQRLPGQPNEDRRLFRVIELAPAPIMRTASSMRKFLVPTTYHARAGIGFRSHPPVPAFTGRALGSRAFGCIRRRIFS